MREMKFITYLLGTISEPERTAIDRSLLTNDDEFEQFLLAEDDLIEAYLRHELSAVEQTQFEQFFLADPERQQKLRLAQALQRYANDPSKSLPGNVTTAAAATTADSWWAVFQRPVWQWAMASSLLVVALFVARAVIKTDDLTQVAHSSPSPTVTIAPTTLPIGTAVARHDLYPGQDRGAFGSTTPLIKLAPETGSVELTLHLLKAAYPSYEVILIADDEEPQKLGQFKPQITKDGSSVIVSVPVTKLSRGGHRIRLEGLTPNGTERVATYYFTANR